MKNTVVSLIDENFNQFTKNENTIDFVEKVPEFNKILEEKSNNGNFFIDYKTYECLGFKNYPLRSTRVFLDEGEEPNENDEHTKFNKISDVKRKIREYSNKEIFFMGGEYFLKKVFPFSNSIYICVVESDKNSFDKFPVNTAKQFFKNKKEIKPKMLEMIRDFKELDSLDDDDEIYNCPDNYCFFEFDRTKKVGGENELKNRFLKSLKDKKHNGIVDVTLHFDTLVLNYFLENENLSINVTETHKKFKKSKNKVFDVKEETIKHNKNFTLEDSNKIKIKQQKEFNEFFDYLNKNHVIKNIWSLKL